MAKRKQNQYPTSTDVIRWAIATFLVLAAVSISWLALSAYVRHAGIFIIKDVVIAEKMGEVKIPELEKLKGQNIFLVDLEKVQAKVMARYPQVAGLKVLRRLPDEISVSGERRTAFTAAVLDGKSLAVSRDGYFIGVPGKEDGPLVQIKGLQRQKSSPGTKVEDTGLEAAFKAVEQVKKDPELDRLHLRSLDVSDPNKITFAFGLAEDAAKFDVVVDKTNFLEKLKVLSVMVTKTELAINEVKYIDLRFDAPVIGKKKAKK